MRLTLSLILCCTIAGILCDEIGVRIESLDVDEVFNNERLIKAYVDCLLDRGKCVAEVSEFKKLIPVALETDCAKCSKKTRSNVIKFLRLISNKKPEWWAEIIKKYDGDGQYRVRYAELVKEEGILIP